MSEGEDAYLVDRSGGVLTLSFNRPDHGNAIPGTAVPGLIDLFRGAASDPSVRAILVRGEGKHFSAGGDVKGFAKSLEMPAAERQADFRGRLVRLRELVEVFADLPIPVVAACRGGVAGAGLMYALGADVVLADPTAAFVFAHQKVGLSPDGGVSWLLPRVVGTRKAKELMLSAARVEAEEAYRIGLVSRIVEADALEAEALKLAQRFARAPQTAIRSAKRLIEAASTAPRGDILDGERDAIVACVGDADFEEGVRAFIEKRQSSFPSAR